MSGAGPATLKDANQATDVKYFRPPLSGSASRKELVGKANTAQLGLEPGDEFEIKLGRKQIELIPPAPVRVLKAAGETDQVIGNTTSSANVSVGLHTLPFISREWDGCMGRPKGKEPQSCCTPFRCWPPPV